MTTKQLCHLSQPKFKRIRVTNHVLHLDYICPGLRLTNKEAAAYSETLTSNLVRNKKLHLVLDIDHTLIHAVSHDQPRPEDIDFFKQNQKIFEGSLFTFECESTTFLVKLRPLVRTFLEQANSLFEMSLYTRGTKMYARSIAKLLDPQGIYFGKRIISVGFKDEKYRNKDKIQSFF
ncbi:RNA polymerase II C-terminal domain phosphatase-like 5 [Rutidosis leptorrhynchoides]|uniref:RNA polymerase II C-terminal domain phosphatase-like 5 n=1 Tax=Rutidosis leptorrhynchoides TaxID=125765 RepID=UPI003A9927A6